AGLPRRPAGRRPPFRKFILSISLDPLLQPLKRSIEAAPRKFAILRGSHRTDLRTHPDLSCVENGQHQGGFSFALKREPLRQKLARAERRKNIAAANDQRSAPIPDRKSTRLNSSH